VKRNNERDWWYGASAAFPRAIEWQVWFDFWKDRYAQSQPVEKLIVDATMKLHQTYVKLAQAIRKNDGWTRLYTEDEMKNILDITGEAASWFARNKPREDQLKALDPRLVFVVKALEGGFAVASALAAEQDQINRKGYVLVDMSAEHRELSQSLAAS
jgi:hypothetical protein